MKLEDTICLHEMLRKNSAGRHLQHEKLATAARFQPEVLLYSHLGALPQSRNNKNESYRQTVALDL